MRGTCLSMIHRKTSTKGIFGDMEIRWYVGGSKGIKDVENGKFQRR